MPVEHKRPKHTKTRKLPDIPPRKTQTQRSTSSQPQPVDHLKALLPPPKPQRSFTSSIKSTEYRRGYGGVDDKRRASLTNLNQTVNTAEYTQPEGKSLPCSPDQTRKNTAEISHQKPEELVDQLRLRYNKYVNDTNRNTNDTSEVQNEGSSKAPALEATAVKISVSDQSSSPGMHRRPYSIKSFRCDVCKRPIIPQERVAAEDHMFHQSCFNCSICHVSLTLQGYCYIPSHEKFYCIFHYADVSGIDSGLSDSDGDSQGVGPGVDSFRTARATQSSAHNVTDKEERMTQATALAKELHQLRSSRRKLERKEEKERMKLKKTRHLEVEGYEMNAQHDKLERQLRAITQKQDDTRSENDVEKEHDLLDQILSLVEKRDNMVTQLNAQRKSQAEVEKILKAQKQEKGLVSAPDLIQGTTPEMDKLPSKVKKQARFACLQCTIS